MDTLLAEASQFKEPPNVPIAETFGSPFGIKTKSQALPPLITQILPAGFKTELVLPELSLDLPLTPQPQSPTLASIVPVSLIVEPSLCLEEPELTVSSKFQDKLLNFGTPSTIKDLETLQAEPAQLTLIG
jgi:hypothetical protein